MDDDKVIVHSCQCRGQRDQPESALVKEVNYLRFMAPERKVVQPWETEVREIWCRPLPPKCKCRKRMSRSEANKYVDSGRALLVYRFKDSHLVNTLDSRYYRGRPLIWMPVERGKTPRVDLITSADIERAAICSCKRMPGMRLVHAEKCVAKKYIEYIEEVHQIYLDNRAALIVPFIPDEYEGFAGRVLLISFGEGQRPSLGRDVSPVEMAHIKERFNV